MSEATRELQIQAADALAKEMEKIGDGKILQWIIDHKAEILSLIQLFIGFFPKVPTE